MSPNRLGPRSIISTYFDDTLGAARTAYLPGRLLMPQATEKARNGPDQWLAALGLSITLDAARESFASGGSSLARPRPVPREPIATTTVQIAETASTKAEC